jgi:hypothetical protein
VWFDLVSLLIASPLTNTAQRKGIGAINKNDGRRERGISQLKSHYNNFLVSFYQMRGCAIDADHARVPLPSDDIRFQARAR